MNNILATLANEFQKLQAENQRLKTPLAKKNEMMALVSTRSNSTMEFFLPHSKLIIFNISRGCTVAALARYIFSKDNSGRYSDEHALYQALAKWVRLNCKGQSF